jgi:hypothetical protein
MIDFIIDKLERISNYLIKLITYNETKNAE